MSLGMVHSWIVEATISPSEKRSVFLKWSVKIAGACNNELHFALTVRIATMSK